MIDFDLKAAHKEYHDLITETFTTLSEIFPAAPVKKVLVYPPEPAKNSNDCANRSLGDATEPGVIRLNGYWFSEPVSVLVAAGEVPDNVPDFPHLRWHGGMPQPGQVLCHEFFHILRDGLGPSAETFSHDMWLKSTKDPASAFSGYSLYNPSEWWAECGAGLLLGGGENLYVKELDRFLTASVAKDDLPLFDPSKHPRGPDGSFRKAH